MRVERDVTFTEDDVVAWCRQSGDHNPLHLDEQEAQEHPFFDGRVVPGMQVLDQVSGLITQWAETKEGEPVLSRLTAINFTEPVEIGEEATVTIEEEDEDDSVYILDFEVSTDDEQCIHGYATVYVL